MSNAKFFGISNYDLYYNFAALASATQDASSNYLINGKDLCELFAPRGALTASSITTGFKLSSGLDLTSKFAPLFTSSYGFTVDQIRRNGQYLCFEYTSEGTYNIKFTNNINAKFITVGGGGNGGLGTNGSSGNNRSGAGGAGGGIFVSDVYNCGKALTYNVSTASKIGSVSESTRGMSVTSSAGNNGQEGNTPGVNLQIWDSTAGSVTLANITGTIYNGGYGGGAYNPLPNNSRAGQNATGQPLTINGFIFPSFGGGGACGACYNDWYQPGATSSQTSSGGTAGSNGIGGIATHSKSNPYYNASGLGQNASTYGSGGGGGGKSSPTRPAGGTGGPAFCAIIIDLATQT